MANIQRVNCDQTLNFLVNSPDHQLFILRYSVMKSFVFGKTGGYYIISPALL